MDDEPHIRFVDPHPEGVGRDNDAQAAFDKCFLNILLGFWRQLRVIVPNCPCLLPEKIRYFLGLLAGRAIDYRSTAGVCGKIGLQNLVYVGKLLRRTGRNDVEIKIRTSDTTVDVT